jgi:ABC-type phosphate transport system substrate-binding protein
LGLFFKHVLAAFCAFYALTATHIAHAEEPRPLAIIVSSNAETAVIQQLSLRDLAPVYWKKKQYWQGGARIRPVNLHAEHPLRIYFSKVVLGSVPSEQGDYWNGLYFHGTTPPYSVQSEEAVLRYVSITKGAIGYIDACNLDDRVKPLLWIDDNTISNNKPALNCQP